jgi:cytochrome c oxidase assembly factor CtaG/putative copper export protein
VRTYLAYTLGVKTLLPLSAARAAVIVVVGALLALLAGLMVGGGATPLLLVDPGAAVRYGLPVAKVLVNLGAAVSLGSLLVAAFALSHSSPAFDKALLLSALGAGVWTVSAATTAFFTFLAVYLEPVSTGPQFGELLWLFMRETDIGRAWLITVGLAGLVTVMSLVVRSFLFVGLTGVVAVAALWPMAEQGHAAGAANHSVAVSSSFVHYVFAAFWLGGLVIVAVIAWSEKPAPRDFATTVARYSSIALVSFIAVAASGLTNALVRVGSLEGLSSGYGVLVVSKVVALVGLGAFGVAYRRKLIGALAQGRTSTSVMGRILGAELVLMGVASGLAAALARTQTPVPEVVPTEFAQATPAEILTGDVLPPEFEWWRLATEWKIDLIWALIVVFGIFFYVAGHWRLARRGDRWPISRTLSFVSGMLVLAVATQSGLAVYGTYLFSIHMIGHMILSMAVPLMFVLSAPVTLASRAIAARKDGSRGAREWILAIVHSRYLGVIGHPLVAAAIFALSLIVFYYSPLFEWALEEHLGHQWMTAHFILTGYLFAQALVGVDPSPHNPAYPLRLMIVLGTMAFHAFFGLSLIYGTGLLAPEWYGAMGREWGLSPLLDQQRGGELAWGLGEIPTLVLAIVVTYSWSKSDDRKNKRRDRQADRDGDQELNAYNDMLQARQRAEQRLNRG